MSAEVSHGLGIEDFVPWHDTTLWPEGKFYPLPHSRGASFDGIRLWHLGVSWGVYRRLNPQGDVLSIISGLSMEQACALATSLNEPYR